MAIYTASKYILPRQLKNFKEKVSLLLIVMVHKYEFKS